MNEHRQRALKSSALWVTGINIVLVLIHSVAHEVLRVKATPAQLAFIVPFILVGPPAAGALLPKWTKAGARVLLASMIGSFFFGLYYHFVADTIDHVSHVARMEPALWSWAFRATAYLLLVFNAWGAFGAGRLLAAESQPSEHYAARTGV